MKFSYFIIPIAVAATAYMRSKYIKLGAKAGNPRLDKPKWAPGRKLIREVWIFLYLLITVSLILFWGVTQLSVWHYFLGAIFIVNAYLNVVWCKAFFIEQKIARAYKLMMYLNITTVAAILIMWPIYLLPALLLLPYLIWTIIVMKLNKEIWNLNRG